MKICNVKGNALKAFISALLILEILCVYSQKNLQPGYIVTTNGDKVKGYIDYRNWGKNPQSIIFSETLQSKSISYTPAQIKGFAVQNEIYESAIVTVDETSYLVHTLTYSGEFNYRTDTAFLATLFQGDKSLYYYKDRAGKENFYIKQNSKFELLVFQQYLEDLKQNGETVVRSNNEYIKQLGSYFSNCSSVEAKLFNVKYTEKELSNLFSAYYKSCPGSEVQFEKKREKTVLEKGILAGLTSTSLKFVSASSTNAAPYLKNADFSNSVNIAGGLFLNVVLARYRGKWSMANELLFTSFKVTGTYNEYHNEEYYILYKTTIGFSQVRLINMVRYKFPVNNIFFYVNAGITNALAFSETNIRKKESHLYAPPTFEESKALDPIRKYEQGLILGLGTRLKMYSIDLRIEKGNGMAYGTIGSPSTKLYLLLGYSF